MKTRTMTIDQINWAIRAVKFDADWAKNLETLLKERSKRQ